MVPAAGQAASSSRRRAATTLEAACYREVRRLAARARSRDRASLSESRCAASAATTSTSSWTPAGRSISPSSSSDPRARSGSSSRRTIELVPLPAAKAVLAIQFDDLLEALGATPAILAHGPVRRGGDGRVHPEPHEDERGPASAAADVRRRASRRRCCASSSPAIAPDDLPPRLDALEADLRRRGSGVRCHRAIEPAAQQAIWHVREAALGLSMSMKGDAKALSFVEDAAVPPERLRDYIRDLLALVAAHGTEAGVYAHASVGCLHVRPVIDLKTDAGVRHVRVDRVGRRRPRPCSTAARCRASTATAWCAARSWSACSAPCCTARSGRSSGRSIRTACSIPARSSTRRRIATNLRYGGGVPDRASRDHIRLRGTRRVRRRGRDVQRPRRLPQDATRGRCARRSWRRETRRTRRAAARTRCGSRCPASSARPGWRTRPCARCSICASSAAPARASVRSAWTSPE